MTDTRTFVLVHGSWQGAWSWDGVRDQLRARGHHVITPALPGRGDISEDRSWIGHDDNVAAVLAALDADGADPVVLAGHSLGGVTISQVADQRPDRIARLVYCDAFVLEDGESVADVLPEEFRGAILELAATRTDRAIPMPWEVWRANFVQTAGEQLARESHQRLVPDPYRPVFEPVRLRRPVHRELPVTFLAFTQDLALPPGPAFWHPGMTGRLNGATVTQIDGDHQILLTAPERLADALHQAATEQPARRSLSSRCTQSARAARAGEPPWRLPGPQVDSAAATTCNDGVTTDGAHQTDADIISSGREPRPRAWRPGGLVWLLIIAETVALAVSVAVALHYRADAGALQRGGRSAASLAGSPMPEVTSVVLQLPAAGGVAGTVVITAAILPGAVLAQFTVSAVITGGTPGTFYDLIGNDCASASPLGNHVWATGIADPHGTADLVGYAWTGAVADFFWLALDPLPVARPPGLHGQFAAGRAAPFPAGQAPCAPSPL